MEHLVVQEEGVMKTRGLTGQEVDRYVQTDYTCLQYLPTSQPTQSILVAQQCIPMKVITYLLVLEVFRVGLRSGVESMLLSH